MSKQQRVLAAPSFQSSGLFGGNAAVEEKTTTSNARPAAAMDLTPLNVKTVVADSLPATNSPRQSTNTPKNGPVDFRSHSFKPLQPMHELSLQQVRYSLAFVTITP